MKPVAQNPIHTASTMLAQRYATEITTRLAEIARSLIRLVELQQAPRRNYLAAGTLAGSGTVGTTPASCTNTVLGLPPGTILAANPEARGRNIQNTGTAGSLTIGLGTSNPIAGQGLVLPPGASWDGRISGSLWNGSVSVIGSQAGVTYCYLEVQGSGAHGTNSAF